MANLVNTLNYTANQIDTAELSKIKNQFLLRSLNHCVIVLLHRYTQQLGLSAWLKDDRDPL